ncbi:MAG: hypothetical protein K2Y20_07105 [Sphingomonas sp.]|nr:hypothetical protein [Sphingomonas sp.]
MRAPIVGPVMAMARPARPVVEAELVRIAAAALPADLSASRRAEMIAQRVAVAVVEHVDQRGDAHLSNLLMALANDPIARLAIDPLVATGAMLASFREAAMNARDWRYPSPAERDAENALAINQLAAKLAARYRRHL